TRWRRASSEAAHRRSGRPGRDPPARARRRGSGHVGGRAVPRARLVRHRHDTRRGRRILPWPLTDVVRLLVGVEVPDDAASALRRADTPEPARAAYCGASATPWNMVAEAAVAMVVTGGDAEPSSTTTTSLFCVASPVVATRVTSDPVTNP